MEFMCGIVGYIGNAQGRSHHSGRLKRLEYRGYDSAGIAVYCDDETLGVRRASGKLRNLEEAIRLNPVDGTLRHRPHALGHARPPHRGERAPASRLHTATSWWCTTASSKITWR